MLIQAIWYKGSKNKELTRIILQNVIFYMPWLSRRVLRTRFFLPKQELLRLVKTCQDLLRLDKTSFKTSLFYIAVIVLSTIFVSRFGDVLDVGCRDDLD